MTYGDSKRGQGTTPVWAKVVGGLIRKEHNLEAWPVDIRWRYNRTGKTFSSGRTVYVAGSDLSGTYVTVTAGSNTMDEIVVFIHEMAHVVVGHGEGHSYYYWQTAYRLFQRFDLPFAYCYYRSSTYRDTAWWVAEQMYDIPEDTVAKCRAIAAGRVKMPRVDVNNWYPKKFDWRDLLGLE